MVSRSSAVLLAVALSAVAVAVAVAVALDASGALAPATPPRGEPQDAAAPAALPQLRVDVVDAATGRGLSAIECVAYSIRSHVDRLERARTDGRGRADFHGLPEGSVRIEALRRAPHAVGLAAAWIPAEGGARATLPLGRGGVLEGRVVEPSGAPVAGLEIGLFPTKGEVRMGRAADGVSVAETHTDASGRFRVARVWSPRSVHAREDREVLRGGREPVQLVLGLGLEYRGDVRSYFVLEGETIDVGDLTVAPETSVRGRVLGADGEPLAGALVSTHPLRLEAMAGRAAHPLTLAAVPSSATFRLLPTDEALTDEDGTFELRSRRPPPSALVRSPAGVGQHFALPAGEPGIPRECPAWTLEHERVLEVCLVDGNGTRLREGPGWKGWGRPHLMGTRYPFEGGAGAWFELTRRGGERVRFLAFPDDAGVFRPPLPFPRHTLERLEVAFPGWRMRAVGAADLLTGEGPVEVELAPLPRLLLRVHVPAQELARVRRLPEWMKLTILEVHVCRRVEDRDCERCCGDGSRFSNWVDLESGAELELDLPVQVDLPCYVHVTNVPCRGPARFVFGPYEPSEERIAIEIPRLQEHEPDPVAAGPAEVEADLERVELEGLVRSAEDSERAPRRGSVSGESTWGPLDSRGRFLTLAGENSERLSISAWSFEDVELTLPPLDRPLVSLGTIELRPEPEEPRRPRVRVEGEGGADAYLLLVHVGPPGEERPQAWLATQTPPDGLRTDLEAWAYDRDYGLRAARLVADETSGELRVELGPAFPVEIRLRGLPGDELFTSIALHVLPTPVQERIRSRTDVFGVRTLAAREVLFPSPARERRFAARLAPGDYEVEVTGSDVFASQEPFELHVREAAGVQVFEWAAGERR